jgi:membrane associated rhomboid family serine protease
MVGIWLSLFFFIERRFTVTNRLLRITAFAMMTLLPTTYEPSTSYRTHAIGFVLGVTFGSIYFYQNREKIRKSETINLKRYFDDMDFDYNA